MCGRFFIADDDAMTELIRRLARLEGAALKTGDIRPGDAAPVYLNEGRIEPKAMTWGFKREKGGLIINARGESAAQKPMFRELWQSSRLLIPAHAYYEWDSVGNKHIFDLKGGMYLAGLFMPSDRRFVVLTREAAPGLDRIHPRMPVIFGRASALEWLKPSNDPMRVLAIGSVTDIKETSQQLKLDI